MASSGADELQYYKIVVLGGGGVGKSALTIRLVTDNFLEEYDPTIEDCYRKSVIIDDRNAVLDILDTAGQEEFSSMQDQWMREGKAFCLVYSITSMATFQEVDLLYQKILRAKEGEKYIPIVLCGNKCDLDETQREVSKEEGSKKAAAWGCPFFETSAKAKINHEACFYECVREIRIMERKNTTTTSRKSRLGRCVLL